MNKMKLKVQVKRHQGNRWVYTIVDMDGTIHGVYECIAKHRKEADALFKSRFITSGKTENPSASVN
jgi:hypothetical protein